LAVAYGALQLFGLQSGVPAEGGRLTADGRIILAWIYSQQIFQREVAILTKRGIEADYSWPKPSPPFLLT
jgi:hypothetical protein